MPRALGASSFQIGLLSAGPAIINFLFSLPVGRWLESQPLIRACFLSSVWNRLGYVALVFLPWIFSNPDWLVWVIVLITLLMSIPGTIMSISFYSVFANLVPQPYRASVIGRRNALLAVFTTIAVLVSGQILDYVHFDLNYQIVFLIGAAGAMLSSYIYGA
ncbi:MAG: MFS transporter [Omnitrophica WOR_2 bacterium]